MPTLDTMPGHKDNEALRRRADVIKTARASLGIRTLDEVVRATIRHAWVSCAHDATLTAQCLGIARSTLYRYLKRYGFDQWT